MSSQPAVAYQIRSSVRRTIWCHAQAGIWPASCIASSFFTASSGDIAVAAFSAADVVTAFGLTGLRPRVFGSFASHSVTLAVCASCAAAVSFSAAAVHVPFAFSTKYRSRAGL